MVKNLQESLRLAEEEVQDFVLGNDNFGRIRRCDSQIQKRSDKTMMEN